MIPLPESIESERLVIRPFKSEDRDGYLAFMTNPKATQYLMFTDEQRTEEGAQALLEAVQGSYSSEEPIFAYAIALKEDDTFIGSCGLSELDEPARLECYYSLLPSYWKRGYATEATAALLRYCFAQDGVDEVWAFMSKENPTSAGVAERIGMENRGIQVHPVFGNEGRAYVMKGGAGGT
jgi:RimJ/RimL family protein N-acetyltransferase